jgi:hypothetical protein
MSWRSVSAAEETESASPAAPLIVHGGPVDASSQAMTHNRPCAFCGVGSSLRDVAGAAA